MAMNNYDIQDYLFLANLVVSFVGALLVTFKTYKAMKKPNQRGAIWFIVTINVVIFSIVYVAIFAILGALILYSFPVDFSR